MGEMKKWFLDFWSKHGERQTFAFEASVMAIVFVIVGMRYEPLESMVGVGVTILTGVAMLFFNKVRSPNGNGNNNNGGNNETIT